jgi:iron complex transport system ATP-binding protein
MKPRSETTHSIELRNLSIGYHTPGRKSVVYGPLNLEIKKAEMVGIIGRNGIGKSTLLRTIAGLQPHLEGQVLIDGIPGNRISLKDKAKMISFVSTEHIHAYQIRVNEMIAMGRFPYTGWLGKLNDEDKRAIHEAVELTGIGNLLSKPIEELSDGEYQKVMIARALTQDTPIIVLDEPTAFLDLPARYEILRILNDLTLNNQKTILFSTHDLSIALDIADKLWVMVNGEIFQGAPEDLLINKVFGKLFVNSPAEFDVKTSVFRFKKELRYKLVIQGEKKYRQLTKRAMQRIGFDAMEDVGADVIVNIEEQKGLPLWTLFYKEARQVFESLYDLSAYLKKNSIS